jgi:hypothetical protein
MKASKDYIPPLKNPINRAEYQMWTIDNGRIKRKEQKTSESNSSSLGSI